ncbi:MAG: GSCFA domain-containing protein, partial [Bacteroidaceae bacterium]|nr:GSCFA domain-containing protein [Bacteroidaceae bacterium]
EKLFDRVRMSVADIVNLWKGLLDSVFSVNPGLRVVFTVSPIRHKRDGLHVNQLSKSILLLAVDELCGMYPQCCSYFPSYEILIDELRDYRFYADDLVHPSSLAVEYIWERMCESFLSKETLELMKQLAAVTAALNHKPFNAESAEYAAFMENTLKKINELKNMHPYLNMDAELKICNTKLRK